METPILLWRVSAVFFGNTPVFFHGIGGTSREAFPLLIGKLIWIFPSCLKSLRCPRLKGCDRRMEEVSCGNVCAVQLKIVNQPDGDILIMSCYTFWLFRFMLFLLPLFVEPILHLYSWNARTCDFLRDHVNSCRMSILNTPKITVQQMWFIFKAQSFRPYKSISVTQILLSWHSMWWLYLPEVIGISMNSMGIWN